MLICKIKPKALTEDNQKMIDYLIDSTERIRIIQDTLHKGTKIQLLREIVRERENSKDYSMEMRPRHESFFNLPIDTVESILDEDLSRSQIRFIDLTENYFEKRILTPRIPEIFNPHPYPNVLKLPSIHIHTGGKEIIKTSKIRKDNGKKS